MRTERIGYLTVQDDPTGSRTPNLPSCGAVSQQTASLAPTAAAVVTAGAKPRTFSSFSPHGSVLSVLRNCSGTPQETALDSVVGRCLQEFAVGGNLLLINTAHVRERGPDNVMFLMRVTHVSRDLLIVRHNC